jgi:hypothetical protein
MDPRQTGDAREEKPLILILVKRAAIFCFVVCSISFFYWVVGSLSSYLDQTQSMLVAIMRISSLGIVVASGIGALLSIAYSIAGRGSVRLAGALGYLAAAAAGGLALAIAQSVSILSLGLR